MTLSNFGTLYFAKHGMLLFFWKKNAFIITFIRARFRRVEFRFYDRTTQMNVFNNYGEHPKIFQGYRSL